MTIESSCNTKVDATKVSENESISLAKVEINLLGTDTHLRGKIKLVLCGTPH